MVWVLECLQSPWQTNEQKRLYSPLLRYNWQIKLGYSVYSVMIWRMWTLWKDLHKVIHPSPHIVFVCFFVFWWECLRSLLANFSYTITVLSTIVTMLFINSSQLTHLNNWQLINYQFTNLCLFLPASIPWWWPSYCLVSVNSYKWYHAVICTSLSDLFLLLRA